MTKPFDLDHAIGEALDRALEDVHCKTCDQPGHHATVRVTAYGPSGDPGDINISQYACDDCVDTVLGLIRRLYPNAAVYDLPGKAHRQKLPLWAGPDPARHVDLDVADQVEKLLTRAPAESES